MKLLFTSDRINTIAPGRNIVLRPLLGPQSLLLQEGAEHLRRRKLMLPPFHGERMRAYEAAIARGRGRARSRPGRPGREFPLHPSMQAITLEVIMRAVFGVTDPARRDALRDGLIAVLARVRLAGGVRAHDAAGQGAAATTAGSRPGSRARTSCLAAEIAERRADPELESRDDILSMLVSADVRRRLEDVRRRAPRPAPDAAARRPRDHRDRARLDVRPAPAHAADARAPGGRARRGRERLPRRGDRRVAAGAPGGAR